MSRIRAIHIGYLAKSSETCCWLCNGGKNKRKRAFGPSRVVSLWSDYCPPSTLQANQLRFPNPVHWKWLPGSSRFQNA